MWFGVGRLQGGTTGKFVGPTGRGERSQFVRAFSFPLLRHLGKPQLPLRLSSRFASSNSVHSTPARRCSVTSLAPAPRLCESRRIAARYGLRAVRVGEASHPGPGAGFDSSQVENWPAQSQREDELACLLPPEGSPGGTSAQRAGLHTRPRADLDSSQIREWPADLQCEEEHAAQLQAQWEAGRAAWHAEWDAQSLPPFVAASAYQPPPPGFVFKLGSKGLGFYRDAPPVLRLQTLLHRPAAQVAPLQLRLDQLVPGPARSLPEQAAAFCMSAAVEDGMAAVQRAYEAAAFSRLRPKQQAAFLADAAVRARKDIAAGTSLDAPPPPGDLGPRTRGPRAAKPRAGPLQCSRYGGPPDEADSTQWPDDGSLAAACTRHRAAGVWAIDTVNANAWTGTCAYLRATAADIVVAQEVRLAAEHCAGSEASLLSIGWRAALTPCLHTEAGGKSAGVVVAVRKHVGMAGATPLAGDWPQLDGRFDAKRIGAVAHGGITVATCYLHTGIGISAEANLNLLHAIAATLRPCAGNWLLGGDFNCTPDQLRATGWLELVGGSIVAPSAPTCGERTIDFFVIGASLAHTALSAHTVGDDECRPHHPVRCLLRAKPRHALHRTLATPVPIPAILPHGPAPAAAAPARGDGNDLHGCLDLIESELAALAGRTAPEPDCKHARSKGPRYVWRNPLTSAPPDKGASTSITRAWRRSAGWLADLRKARAEAARSAAIWKLRFYRHPWPHPAGATVAQRAVMDAFLAWQSCLATQLLQSQACISMFERAAVAQAEKLEAMARAMDSARWLSWLHEGPSLSLRRQHRLSRAANGWIACPTAGGSPSEAQQSPALSGRADRRALPAAVTVCRPRPG